MNKWRQLTSISLLATALVSIPFVAVEYIRYNNIEKHLYKETKRTSDALNKIISYKINPVDFEVINTHRDLGRREFAKIHSELETIKLAIGAKQLFIAKPSMTSKNTYIYIADSEGEDSFNFIIPGTNVPYELNDILSKNFNKRTPTIVSNLNILKNTANFAVVSPIVSNAADRNVALVYAKLDTSANHENLRNSFITDLITFITINFVVILLIIRTQLLTEKKARKFLDKNNLLLQKSNNTINELSNSAINGILIAVYPENKIIFCNQKFKDIHGFPSDTVITVALLHEYRKEHIPLEDCMKLDVILNDLVNIENVDYVYKEFDMHVRNTLSNSYLTVSAKITVTTVNEKEKHIVFSLYDISKHTADVADNLFQRKLYRDTLIHDSEFIILTDLTTGTFSEDNIIKKNADLEKIIDKDTTNLENLFKQINNSINFIHKDDEKKFVDYKLDKEDLIQQYKANNTTIHYQFSLLNENNKVYDLVIELSENPINEHLMAFFVIKDKSFVLSKKLEEEQKIVKTKQEFQKSINAKYNAIASIAKEINTPVKTLQSLSNILKQEKNDPNKVETINNYVLDTTEQIAAIVENILDIQNTDTVFVETLDLQEIFNEVVDFTTKIASSQNITVINDNSKDFKYPIVKSNAHYIRTILTNIANNAVQFNKEQGIVIFDHQIISVKNDEAIYRFTIRDSGIGISKKYLNQIFEAFTKIHSNEQYQTDGLGLGLTICKYFVERLNGNIEVDSTENEGSTFEIIIPVKIVAGDVKKLRQELRLNKEQAQKFDFSGLKILLAESNYINLKVKQYILKQYGAEVDIASNGAIAIDTYSAKGNGYYDLVIIDSIMPITNGNQVYNTIRSSSQKDAKKIPIIIFTDKNSKESKLDADTSKQKLNYSRFKYQLYKPIEINELLAVINGIRIQIEVRKDAQIKEEADTTKTLIDLMNKNLAPKPKGANYKGKKSFTISNDSSYLVSDVKKKTKNNSKKVAKDNTQKNKNTK